MVFHGIDGYGYHPDDQPGLFDQLSAMDLERAFAGEVVHIPPIQYDHRGYLGVSLDIPVLRWIAFNATFPEQDVQIREER